MRVLITGGSGFIGLALAAELKARGAEVESFALTPPPAWAEATLAAAPGDGSVRTRVGDARDRTGLDRAFEAVAPEIVVHAAASTPDLARERAGGAADILDVNIGGTATVVEAAAAAGVRRIVALSSGAVYGQSLAETPRLDETETTPEPATLYGVSKHAAERVALRLGALHAIEVVAPRLGAAWGPWEHRTSLRPTPSPAHQIVEKARQGAPIVFAGPATAPLLFAEDAAAALADLAVAPSAAVSGRGVNVGAERSEDLVAFAEAVAAALRPSAPSPVSIGPEPTIALFAADRPPMRLERLRAAIGDWTPRPIDAQIARMTAWLETLDDADAPFKV